MWSHTYICGKNGKRKEDGVDWNWCGKRDAVEKRDLFRHLTWPLHRFLANKQRLHFGPCQLPQNINKKKTKDPKVVNNFCCCFKWACKIYKKKNKRIKGKKLKADDEGGSGLAKAVKSTFSTQLLGFNIICTATKAMPIVNFFSSPFLCNSFSASNRPLILMAYSTRRNIRNTQQ